MHRTGARLALALLLAGCARYEYVNELDVPGRCPAPPAPPAPRAVPADSARGGPSDTLAAPALRGRVVAVDSAGASVASMVPGGAAVAAILLGDSLPTATATGDEVGRFALPPLAPGRYLLRTRRIGFEARRDTLDLPLAVGRATVLPMRLDVTDGPCSGMFAVRVRKPWWKLW